MTTARRACQRLTKYVRRTVAKAAAENIAPALQDAALTAFIQFGEQYFPEHLTDSGSKLHAWIKEFLGAFHLNRGQRQVVVAPRGAAKSTWFTLIYVLYCALHRIEPYIIIISDTALQARIFLKRIKDELEYNEALRAAFPATCRRWEIWRSDTIELANGVRIEAFGKGTSIRGRIDRANRPTLIILDDPQNKKDTYSELQLDKDFEWLTSDVLKAGTPTTNVVVIGTALAGKAIVCQLKDTPTWKHKRFPQLLAEPRHSHLWVELRNILFNHQDQEREQKARAYYDAHPEMNEGAEVLWNSRFPLYDVMVQRYSLGERVFASEEQGIPMPPGDAEWEMDLFEWDGFWFDEWPTGNLIEIYALDPSKGKTDKPGDFQAFGRIAVDRYYQFHVEAWLEKLNVTDLCDFMVDIFRNAPGEAVVLEANGFQELLKIPFEHAAKKQGVELPLFTVVNTVAKPVRIRRLTSELSQRLMRFKRGSRGTAMLVEQMRKMRFPLPAGEHDDGPDMLEMGVRIAKKLLNRKYAT